METKLLSNDIGKVADSLVSVSGDVRGAAMALFTAAGKIKEAAATLVSLADEIRTREERSELAAQKATKPKKLVKIRAERERNIRKAVKLFWKVKLMGDHVTRQTAATESGLTKTALSKNGLPGCMRDIRIAIEKEKIANGIQRVDTAARTLLLTVVDEELDKFLKNESLKQKGTPKK
jgi:hypothetical protein